MVETDTATTSNKENQFLLQHLRSNTSENQLKRIRDRVESEQRKPQLDHRNQRATSADAKFNLNQQEQERLFYVRRSFQQALNKLSSNDTKDIGLQEAKKIIESNIDGSCLRIYLSLLCEKHKNSTTANKELQVLLFGHLAKVYKNELLDPLDKPPNILKTVVRICENIHSFMKENSSLIHLACANSLVDILDNCFVQKEDKLSLSLIFYEPMAAIINGGYDMIGQLGASMCIQKLLEYLIKNGHEQLFDFITPKFVQLFYKTKCDNPDFIQCLQLIISHSSLKYVTQYVWEVVQKCLKILENNDTQTYLRKIEACNLLRTIAMHLKEVADLIFGFMHRQVIKSLETAQGDRVLKVRQAAIQAKQQWQLVKCINNEMEEKKQREELHGLSPDEIIQARTGYADINEIRKQVLEEAEQDIEKKAIQRNRPRTAHTESQKDLNFKSGPQKKFKMLKELARLNQELRIQKPYSPTAQEKKILELDQNWSAANRGQAFLKRNLGTGGGNIPGYETMNKKIATESVKRQSIKDLIMEQMRGRLKPGDMEKYMKGDVEIYDVIQKQYEEEVKQFEQQQDPEYQAIQDRLVKDRQKLSLKQDIGGYKGNEGARGDALQISENNATFQKQKSLGGRGNQKAMQEDDDFFVEEAMGRGDQSMMPPGMNDEGYLDPTASAKITADNIPDYGTSNNPTSNFDVSGYSQKKKPRNQQLNSQLKHDDTYNPFKTQQESSNPLLDEQSKSRRRDSQLSGVSFADQVMSGVMKSPNNKSLITKEDQQLLQLASKDTKAAALSILGNKKLSEVSPQEIQKLSAVIGVDEIRPLDLPLVERLTSPQINNQVKEILAGRTINELPKSEVAKITQLLGVEASKPHTQEIIERMTNSVPHPQVVDKIMPNNTKAITLILGNKQLSEVTPQEIQKLKSVLGIAEIRPSDLPLVESLTNPKINSQVQEIMAGRQINELPKAEVAKISQLLGVDINKPQAQDIIQSMTKTVPQPLLPSNKEASKAVLQILGNKQLSEITPQEIQKFSAVIGVTQIKPSDLPLVETLTNPKINNQVKEILAGRQISELPKSEITKIQQLLGVDPTKPQTQEIIAGMTNNFPNQQQATKSSTQNTSKAAALIFGNKNLSDITPQEIQKLKSVIGVAEIRPSDLPLVESLTNPRINSQVQEIMAGRTIQVLPKSEVAKISQLLGVDVTKPQTQQIIEGMTNAAPQQIQATSSNISKSALQILGNKDLRDVTLQDIKKLSAVIGVSEIKAADLPLVESLTNPKINNQVQEILAGRSIDELPNSQVVKISQLLGVDPTSPSAQAIIEKMTTPESLSQQPKDITDISISDVQKLSSVIGVANIKQEDLPVVEKLAQPKINNAVEKLLDGRSVSQLTQPEVIKLSVLLGADPTNPSTAKIIESLTNKDPITKSHIQTKLQNEIKKMLGGNVNQLIKSALVGVDSPVKNALSGKDVSEMNKSQIQRLSDQILQQAISENSRLEAESKYGSDIDVSTIPRGSQVNTQSLLDTNNRVMNKVQSTYSVPEVLERSQISGVSDGFAQQYGTAIENQIQSPMLHNQQQRVQYGNQASIDPSSYSNMNQYTGSHLPHSSQYQPRVLLNSTQDDFMYQEQTVEGDRSYNPHTGSYPTVNQSAQSYQHNLQGRQFDSRDMSGSYEPTSGYQPITSGQRGAHIKISDYDRDASGFASRQDDGSSYYDNGSSSAQQLYTNNQYGNIQQNADLYERQRSPNRQSSYNMMPPPRNYQEGSDHSRYTGDNNRGNTYSPKGANVQSYNKVNNQPEVSTYQNRQRSLSPNSQQYQYQSAGNQNYPQYNNTGQAMGYNNQQQSSNLDPRGRPQNTVSQYEINQRFPNNQFSPNANWSGQLIGQLQNVEKFMKMSFVNLEQKLKNVNYKIGETKHNVNRFQQHQHHQHIAKRQNSKTQRARY